MNDTMLNTETSEQLTPVTGSLAWSRQSGRVCRVLYVPSDLADKLLVD